MNREMVTALAAVGLLTALEWRALKAAPLSTRWFFAVLVGISGLMFYYMNSQGDVVRPDDLLEILFPQG